MVSCTVRNIENLPMTIKVPLLGRDEIHDWRISDWRLASGACPHLGAPLLPEEDAWNERR